MILIDDTIITMPMIESETVAYHWVWRVKSYIIIMALTLRTKLGHQNSLLGDHDGLNSYDWMIRRKLENQLRSD
jgi:hypothetical protein